MLALGRSSIDLKFGLRVFLVAAAVVVGLGGAAQATPGLQLYIPSLSPDNSLNKSFFETNSNCPLHDDCQTWVRYGESDVPWQLWAVANQNPSGGGTATYWEDLRLVASWVGSSNYSLTIASDPNGTDTTLNPVRTGGPFLGGTQRITLPNGVTDVSMHGQSILNGDFKTNTEWAEYDLGALGPAGLQTICDYQGGVNTATCNDGKGWIDKLTLETAGLPKGVSVHFDLWGIADTSTTTTVDESTYYNSPPVCPNGCTITTTHTGHTYTYKVTCPTLVTNEQDVLNFAPYSHDAAWLQSAPTPNALSLLIPGLLALAGLARWRSRTA